MKHSSLVTLAASVVLFTLSLSLSEPVQASQADVDNCKKKVVWNSKLNQVKDKDRRKNIDCLADYINSKSDEQLTMKGRGRATLNDRGENGDLHVTGVVQIGIPTDGVGWVVVQPRSIQGCPKELQWRQEIACLTNMVRLGRPD